MEFHSPTTDAFVYDATYTSLDGSVIYHVQPSPGKVHATQILRGDEAVGALELHTIRSDIVVLHGKPLAVGREKRLLCTFCTFQTSDGAKPYRWSATTLEAELKDHNDDVVATWKRGSKPAFDLTSNRPSVLQILKQSLKPNEVDEIITTGLYAIQKERARIGHAGAFMGGISGLAALSPGT